jgi:hypothetical protein
LTRKLSVSCAFFSKPPTKAFVGLDEAEVPE